MSTPPSIRRTKPRVTLVATLRDGSEIRFRTAAGYDFAGVAQNADRSLVLLAKGWDYKSVLGRTRRAWRDAGGYEAHGRGWTVVRFRKAA